MSAETLAGVNRRCAGFESRHTTVLILTSWLRTRNCCIVCTSSNEQCRSLVREPAGLRSNPGIKLQRHGKKCALRERLNFAVRKLGFSERWVRVYMQRVPKKIDTRIFPNRTASRNHPRTRRHGPVRQRPLASPTLRLWRRRSARFMAAEGC
jgi:hypothetical protein